MAGKGKVTDFVKYDIRQMHVAFTGTVPLSSDDEEELVMNLPHCSQLRMSFCVTHCLCHLCNSSTRMMPCRSRGAILLSMGSIACT